MMNDVPNIARSFLFFVVLIGLSAPAGAVSYPDKPPATDYFVDGAGLLDDASKTQINEIAAALLKDEQIPIYVVTIPTLSKFQALRMRIEGYARKLFDHWGIGSQDRNYGILLLVSRGDRKARIEFGAGFAHRYDREAETIMQTLIVPAFKRGDYPTGITDGVRGLDSLARGMALPKPTPPWWFWPALIAGVIGFAALIYNLFTTGRSGWAWALLVGLGALIVFLLVTAAKSGGSGGGFGGGSGGGGGASGSW